MSVALEIGARATWIASAWELTGLMSPAGGHGLARMADIPIQAYSSMSAMTTLATLSFIWNHIATNGDIAVRLTGRLRAAFFI
jgi:hypothetical protein